MGLYKRMHDICKAKQAFNSYPAGKAPLCLAQVIKEQGFRREFLCQELVLDFEFFEWNVTLKPECHVSEKSNLLHWSSFRFPGL